jgi:hypothetical protein
MPYLDTTFVNKQASDMDKYKHVMGKALGGTKWFLGVHKLLNLTRFLESLDCKVSYFSSNFMQWFAIFYPQKDKAH